MSHGFARIFTDNHGLSGLHSLVMDCLPTMLKHCELTAKIIRVFYDVSNELGHGFVESSYAGAIVVALQEAGLRPNRELSVPIWFRGGKIGQYFVDLVVDNKILLELKAARNLESANEAQLLDYLLATEIEVGLLLNFGLKRQFRRLLFDNERKNLRENPCESVAKVLG